MRGDPLPSQRDQLREVAWAVTVPVQPIGGLSIEQAVATPDCGAPLFVLGAPLATDANSFRIADGDIEGSLSMICGQVHAHGEVCTGGVTL